MLRRGRKLALWRLQGQEMGLSIPCSSPSHPPLPGSRCVKMVGAPGNPLHPFPLRNAAANQAVPSPDTPAYQTGRTTAPQFWGYLGLRAQSWPPAMGTRNSWRPGEGQFCWTRCGDAEQWIVKGIVQFGMPLTYSCYWALKPHEVEPNTPFYGWVSGVLKVTSWQGWSWVHQVGQLTGLGHTHSTVASPAPWLILGPGGATPS